ncbi:MAG: TadE/TadG family type IV pilus assembly protein [Micropruina sp.]|uniref:TadE/TadG family type IV pilus assembly protein n=1 Tax=Micropruina sp. TaxID=2737536 RepID=UPI0039E6F64E
MTTSARHAARHTVAPGERGSAAIEAVIVIPVMILLLLLVMAGGQIALARQTVQAIATDTARTASLARTAPTAKKSALAAAHQALDQQVACPDRNIEMDLRGFAAPVGTPASVSVTVTCRVSTLGLPGLPGVTVTATMQSPIDSYRGRQP